MHRFYLLSLIITLALPYSTAHMTTATTLTHVASIGSSGFLKRSLPGISLFDIVSPKNVHAPRSVFDLQDIIYHATASGKRIALVGAGKSQGGQTVSSQKSSLRVSLHKLNHLICLDVPGKQVTVEAGMTWKQLQEYIAPHGLAIKAMQSYNDFSIGGSISVNVHGQDLFAGQIISTIIAMQILLPTGEIVWVSRTENYELFRAIVGGYGLLGIVIAVTLQLTDDILLERHTAVIDTAVFEAYFNEHIRNNPEIEFYSARFSMGSSDFMEKAIILTYTKLHSSTQKPYLLVPTQQNILVRWIMEATGALPCLKGYRFHLEKSVFSRPESISRNNFLNYSIAELPQDTSSTEYILQEYFLPYNEVGSFIKALQQQTERSGINILNVTGRHVLHDRESLLSFAPHSDMCALVLYIRLPRTQKDRQTITEWTRHIIDTVIRHHGTYYLPYHLLATQTQFEAIYSQWQTLLMLKDRYDPYTLLSNQLYEYYGHPKLS